MGFKEIYTKARSILAKDVRLFDASSTARTNNMPFLPTWFWTAKLGMPRKVDYYELRQYAKAPWVQMVKAAIKKQLMTIEWDIINEDEENETQYEEDILKVKTLLEQPNRMGQTFWEVWGMFMDDVLDLDAGVIYKGRNGSGELVELFAYDGAKFLFDVEEHGLVNGFFQYSYKFPRNQPKYFKRTDIIYGKVGTNTDHYPYGWSPLQSIQQVVELMIQSDRYNKEFFKNNAVPDGIVSIPMEQESLERFKFAWEKEVKGKPHKLIFHNSEAAFTPLSQSNKDMDWLEGQKWYFHVIFGAYGLSPQEVGFYENSTKSTGESQERVTIKNAIKPYLKLISDKINREIIPEIVGHDDIKFKWFPEDDAAEKIKHEQTMTKLTANVITINEVRKMEGMDPVEWGDKPMAMAMQEQMAENGAFEDKDDSKDKKEDNPRDNPKDRDDKKEERDRQKKSSKSFINETIKEFTEDDTPEVMNYDEFLSKKFAKWEKDILSFIDKTLGDEIISKDYELIEKTIGDFIRGLFNSVNTSDFFTQLKSVISVTLKDGINTAEKKLGVDIGVGINFDQQVTHEANRQLDGFYIDGKEWSGIKGVADDVRVEIREMVSKSISDRDSLTDIKNNVKTIMNKYTGGEINGKVTDGRAMKIARTETNRMRNASQIDAYKRTNIVSGLKWDAIDDSRTSNLCSALHGKEIPLDSYFEVSYVESGKAKHWQGTQPPSHPNCFVKGQKVKCAKKQINIEDIKKGDIVTTHKNRERRVITTFKNKYTGFIYSIQTSKGILKCTANHPILTNTGWKEAQDITKNDFVLGVKK